MNMSMKVSRFQLHLALRFTFLDAFDLCVSVCGYASMRRPPEFLTRSQRAFLRVAKGMLICKYTQPLSQSCCPSLCFSSQATATTVASQRNDYDRNRGL